MSDRKARVYLFRDGLGWWLAAFCLLALAGCGGGGSSSSSPAEAPVEAVQEGVFLDAPVSGLRYQTASQSGLTEAGGIFRYRAGESVAFFLQDLPLGQASGAALLTPIELVPGAQDETHPKVTNLCILLQSLDEDGDPDNGITLSEPVRQAVEGRSINLDQPTEQFTQDPEVTGLLDNLNARGVFTVSGSRNLRTIEEARRHFRTSLANRDRDGDGFSPSQGDCNDRNAEMHPGALEVCGDGLDQDCDGADLACFPDEPRTWYLDADGDRYSAGSPLTAQERPGSDYFEASQLLAISGDCDDRNAGVHPGAAEICGDGIDQDCSGADPACPPVERSFWYRDRDGDRYGDGTVTEAATRPGSSYFAAGDLLATAGDCNDTSAGVHPGASEICGDGIDQDCQGGDLACPPVERTLWYRDRDRDGHGDGSVTEAATRPGSSYFAAGDLLATSGDCNDTSAGVHPGASEICGDGIDQDCSGADLACPPPVTSSWYQDGDGDGYSSGTTLAAGSRPAGGFFSAAELVATSGDCNDASSGVHPGATEICGDGIDQDCSGADLACPGGETAFDSRLRELISAYRAQNGLGQLAFDGHLHDLAQEHSTYMYNNRDMNHDGFTDRFNRSGYRTCVENVGWNYPTPEAMFEGWRTSSGHNTNMLNSRIGWAGVSRVGAYITFFACGM